MFGTHTGMGPGIAQIDTNAPKIKKKPKIETETKKITASTHTHTPDVKNVAKERGNEIGGGIQMVLRGVPSCLLSHNLKLLNLL